MGPVMNSLAPISERAPGARVFRAFNNLGWENFANPTFGDVQADLFYAGPEGEALATAERLISDIGLHPVRLGDVDQAPLVDSVTRIWFALAKQHGRHLAFKVLTD